RVERELTEELARLGNRHGAHFGDGLVLHAYGARFRTQARAVALQAERVTAIAAEKHADVKLVLLALQPSEESLHAGVPGGAITFDDGVALRGSELPERRVERNLALLGETPQVIPQRAEARLGPGLDGALLNGFAGIGDHAVEIEIDGVAE